MDSMYENQVWTLLDPPEGIKPIRCKWIFKNKTDMEGNVVAYKARLMVKVMKIKAQRIRDAIAFTTYIGNSILIMENSDFGGCETLETPNIFLFPSVLSLLLI